MKKMGGQSGQSSAADPASPYMTDTVFVRPHKSGAGTDAYNQCFIQTGQSQSADAVTESLKALYEDGTVTDLGDKYADYGLSFDNWVLK